MNKNVSRYISMQVACELWGRAAGRCEFHACNRPLYKHSITEMSGSIGEKAHIWSFSEDGPRGRGPLKDFRRKLNDLANLMLLCHDCHKLIDKDKEGVKFSAQLLRHWKEEHEKRIYIVSGIQPSMKSHVVLYGANIGDEKSLVQPVQAQKALFPNRYPANERPIILSMKWMGEDATLDYWKTEEQNLVASFDRYIRPLIDESNPGHFSVFALGPIPLLIRFGTLFTDKINVDVYQLHREPQQTWCWLQEPSPTNFIIKRPIDMSCQPALIVGLSDRISHDRVYSIMGKKVSLWELTIDSPNNDFLKSVEQLSIFRDTTRKLIAEISRVHGFKVPLSIFPSMPVACAVEFGRARMPKACMPWIIYDHSKCSRQFEKSLTVGG